MDKRKYGANLHILSDDTVKDFEEKYNIYLTDEWIIFSLTYQEYNRAYRLGKKFNIMTNDKTKMSIQPSTIDIWKNHKEYSLFKIQNTINKLIIFNQEPTEENIVKALKEN